MAGLTALRWCASVLLGGALSASVMLIPHHADTAKTPLAASATPATPSPAAGDVSVPGVVAASTTVPTPPPTSSTPSKSPASSPAPSPSRAARPSTRPAFTPIRIAATDPANDLTGVEATECASCVSGSRVQYVGQGHSVRIHLRDVPVAGRRTLVVFYESDGLRPLDIVTDSGKVISLIVPGKDSWIVPAQVSVDIEVPAGDSVLTFFHPSAPAPDLDQFRIS